MRLEIRTERPQISLQSVSYKVAGKTILHDINVEIFAGEIISIIGANGSGKTTFLQMLIGLNKPTGGRIDVQTNQIGYVPQRLDFDRSFPITVKEFLKLYSSLKVETDFSKEIFRELKIDELNDKLVGELSGGELQRVLIANAVAKEPELLLFDEATSAVDLPGVNNFYAILKKIYKIYKPTVVLVSHDLYMVFANTDRVFCLDGCLCCQGAPEFVAKDPEFARIFGEDIIPYLHQHDKHHH